MSKNNTLKNDNIAKIGADLDFASSEAYNRLRMNLSFAVPDKPTGKIVGITSSVPSEGKSYTAINLAYALAKNGHRVLLVDGDMRRPTIANKLGLPSKPGLSNMLIRQVENAIVASPLHGNMNVLVSGTTPPNPSELIGISEMQRLLDVFAHQYDYVMIDLPPVNSVSDPVVISRFIDGMIVVCRHGHSQKRDIADTVRQLEFCNVKILGFVYNGYTNKTRYYRHNKYGKYGKYGKYYNNYGYGAQAQKPAADNGMNNLK
ncbi:MAG: CpsD/CapB family tyrosine-protein kinase [Clostridia bacterium]|nr:CpsD/CapB family tyrosine-protein kinase [Clostridia bacterium]